MPIEISDPINARILAVSEDRVQGFQRDPLGEISRASSVEPPVVIERIQAMLRAGTIRRVRQTLLATNLAQGALVAWQVPQEKLDAAFDYMFQEDPFSGHVVTRSTDAATPGSNYKLWTTLKVPQGYSIAKHCEFLCSRTGAEKFVLLPAKKLFALGVGHIRRRGMEPGSKADMPAEVTAFGIKGDGVSIGLVSEPAELFCEYGMRARKHSPFATTLVLGLANGFIGYVPTPNVYTEGGYECEATNVAPEAGDQLCQTMIDALNAVA